MKKHVIYVASSKSQQIHVWQMNSQGELTLLQIINTPGQGQPMAINLAKMHLYIGIRPIFGVISYYIDEQGLLTEVGRTSLPGGSTHLTTDLQGKTLYSTSYRSSCLSINAIDEQGIVGAQQQIIKGLLCCHSANIDNTNQILWVPCLKENRIRRYKIGQTGYLTSIAPISLKRINNSFGPRHMAFHHNGKYAYVINELSSTVNVIDINLINIANSNIIQTVDIIPDIFGNIKRWAADIHITPDSRWLYCCDRTANIISCILISEDGSTLKLSSYQTTENQPRCFNIDSQGKFLVVAGQQSHHITVYAIEAESGEIMPLSRYAVGQEPTWISILSL